MSGRRPLQAQNYTIQGEDAREGVSAWLGGVGRLRYSPSWRSDSGGMLSTLTFLHLNSQIVCQMSLSLSPANQNAPRTRARREKDCYKRQNAREIFLFAARHRRRNIKRENYTYTVTLLSTLTDLDATFRAMPTTRYYDFAMPVTCPAWDR